MDLSDEARRKVERAVAEARRGRISSQEMAGDLIARLEAQGLRIEAIPSDIPEEGTSSLLLRRAAKLERNGEPLDGLRLRLQAIGG
jgi:hypothetical protein